MNPTADARHLPGDSALAQVFAKHDSKIRSGFITRLDRTSILRKKLIFVRSLVYNVVILVGSAALVAVFVFHDLASNVPESLRLTLSITQGILLLWAISVLLFTTSTPFFLGECRLRLKYGFRSTEIIIRRSPSESLSAPASHEPSELRWRASLRAVDPTLLYSNPASILASDFWVMEHAIIMDVYADMEKNKINEEDLEFTAWRECDGVWTGLELWRLHSVASDQQEVALFKAFLTSKGKRELISAWERLFDSEKTAVTQTPENYKSIVKRFSQEGIDYEAVWSQLQRP
ncbi:hypothetical protein P691DRAFT_800185 [Macrolepiota fuliginosa MF-IS2]|uniref:Uncharacterized protein n=1 Tax=Macrolepiota fuliginosa MF-IS2 TaxID=1400762 RepID=A0A9P5XMG8_9AGAR|nr:hypothetical protein P691DRAFT_800185 [Macrolepiota fuliginosa MF-IS2]